MSESFTKTFKNLPRDHTFSFSDSETKYMHLMKKNTHFIFKIWWIQFKLILLVKLFKSKLVFSYKIVEFLISFYWLRQFPLLILFFYAFYYFLILYFIQFLTSFTATHHLLLDEGLSKTYTFVFVS